MTIENNLRRVITDEQPVNPKYYENMSELLDALIRERKRQALTYGAYLAKIVALARMVQNPEQGAQYPVSLNTRARRALYDNAGKDEALAIALDTEVRQTKKDAWRGSLIKEREVRYAIRKHVPDDVLGDQLFELVKNQSEY